MRCTMLSTSYREGNKLWHKQLQQLEVDDGDWTAGSFLPLGPGFQTFNVPLLRFWYLSKYTACLLHKIKSLPNLSSISVF